MGEKSKISAVIITLNEERNIGRCIESLKDVSDEILVVDSFSTDQTENICLKHKVNFIQNDFVGYAEQKNFAIQLAQFDHILSVDADEALSTKLKYSIGFEKAKGLKDAYEFSRLTNYCGKWIKHGAWYPDRKLRLWNRQKGMWNDRKLHEKVLLEPGTHIHYLKGDLLHYSFYTEEDHLNQIDLFTAIGSKEAFKNGEKVNWFNLKFKPAFRFFRDFILKAGFLDGREGFMISKNSAYSKHLKYKKLKELYREERR